MDWNEPYTSSCEPSKANIFLELHIASEGVEAIFNLMEGRQVEIEYFGNKIQGIVKGFTTQVLELTDLKPALNFHQSQFFWKDITRITKIG